MYTVVPFTLVFIINLLIIFKITKFSSRSQNNKKAPHSAQVVITPPKSTPSLSRSRRSKQMNRTILITTFLLIVLTLPGVIASNFFAQIVFEMEVGPILLNLFDNITFSFPALNFLTLLYTNRMFTIEFKSLIFGIRSHFAKSTNTQLATIMIDHK